MLFGGDMICVDLWMVNNYNIIGYNNLKNMNSGNNSKDKIIMRV